MPCTSIFRWEIWGIVTSLRFRPCEYTYHTLSYDIGYTLKCHDIFDPNMLYSSLSSVGCCFILMGSYGVVPYAYIQECALCTSSFVPSSAT